VDTDWSRRPPARFVRWWYVNVVLRIIRAAFAPTTIVGEEQLKELTGPVIVVANHTSHADTMLLLTALPGRVRRRLVIGAAADHFYTSRSSSLLTSLFLGGIPVDRTKASRKTLEECHRLLGSGWSLMLFPEGGRSPDGTMGEFKAGAAWIARRAKVPVVPIHIAGAFDILPKDKRWPRRHRVTLSVGEPLTVSEGEDARTFNSRIEASVVAMAAARAAEEPSGS